MLGLGDWQINAKLLACMYTGGFIGSIADSVSQSQTPVDCLGCLMEVIVDFN